MPQLLRESFSAPALIGEWCDHQAGCVPQIFEGVPVRELLLKRIPQQKGQYNRTKRIFFDWLKKVDKVFFKKTPLFFRKKKTRLQGRCSKKPSLVLLFNALPSICSRDRIFAMVCLTMQVSFALLPSDLRRSRG